MRNLGKVKLIIDFGKKVENANFLSIVESGLLNVPMHLDLSNLYLDENLHDKMIAHEGEFVWHHPLQEKINQAKILPLLMYSTPIVIEKPDTICYNHKAVFSNYT